VTGPEPGTNTRHRAHELDGAAPVHAGDPARRPGSTPDAHRPQPGGAPAAQAIDLRKVYGSGQTQVAALDGVTATFPVGEFTAIMGPSGSGKSTFMHCLAGLDLPTSGDVVVGGDRLAGMSDKRLTALRRDKVGFIFQQFNLLPTLTAEENITLPLAIAGRKPDRAWFDQVVSAVNLHDRLKHRPTELSGGQQQRVACARALITRPAVIFADEPTGNLDSRSSAEVLNFLRRSVTELGQTIVMVTHEPSAAAYADRVLFLADGRIVDEMHAPTADSVLDRMKTLEHGQDSMYQPVGA
jgi:putative ABC transport system ATP-binding protein